MGRTRSVTTGYVILGLLGLSDALGFLLSGSGDDAPPVLINVIGTILGLREPGQADRGTRGQGEKQGARPYVPMSPCPLVWLAGSTHAPEEVDIATACSLVAVLIGQRRREGGRMRG